jgi:hypothetical protein
MLRRALLLIAPLAVAVAAPAAAHTGATGAKPKLSFHVYAQTGHKMDDVLWTGSRFLDIENTTNIVWATSTAGMPLTQFASMPNLVEETRCVVSPGRYGFPPGVVYCHSPDNKIYEISPDGTSVTVFATLPAPVSPVSDGALTFDNVGDFGHQLVAATGRSGGSTPAGGALYTIGASGRVARVGSYSNPGGADEVIIVPAGFGPIGGEALLTVDAGARSGTIVALSATGHASTIATLPGGPNPIAVIPDATRTAPGQPPAGLYLTNDINPDLYFAPASEFAGYAGDILVGTENTAHFWILELRGKRIVRLAVRHNLRGGNYSLEGCTFAP